MHTQLNDPIIDMTEQNRYTAYVNVMEGRMGFFRFTLPIAGRVYFVIDPQVNSIDDELHAFLRKDGAPDLNDLQDPGVCVCVCVCVFVCVSAPHATTTHR